MRDLFVPETANKQNAVYFQVRFEIHKKFYENKIRKATTIQTMTEW